MSTPAELRVAIVGAGKMAMHHARAVQRSDVSGRLVAVAEPDERLRETFSSAHPGVGTFETLDRLLADESVDVVHVCTPPATHVQLARRALESGSHVYVEKPFAPSASEAEQILTLAERSGLRVCSGHQLLFEPPARRALELLPCIGTLHHVESYFAFRPVRTGRDGREPVRADYQLLDVLPHPVYSLLHFLEISAPGGETRIVSCEMGPGGTLHAFLQRGELTASLVVTLEGRPVESSLRLCGTNGTLHADFVRSTVQHLVGPGSSGIDKLLNPYRLATQLGLGTTRALGARFLRREQSYPGLAEIFEAFYGSIRRNAPSPVSVSNILDTVRVCERVSEEIRSASAEAAPVLPAPRVAVTGGTGFLGRELVDTLVSSGRGVRVLARREPAPWDRIPGVEYRVADLGQEVPKNALDGIETVVHLAAETAGGFEEHQRNSVQAAENIAQGAAGAGARRLIHVSSLAVFSASGGGARIREDTPLEAQPRERGPYVWGKVESEHRVAQVGRDQALDVTIVRPGAIVDFESFEPPGRLGRRLGNVFVAVGSPRDRLGIVRRKQAARLLAWMIGNPDALPDSINLLEPELPTKRELVDRLRRDNPGLLVIWLPFFVLRWLSRVAVLAQQVLRPGGEPVNLERVFAVDAYDTRAVGELAERADQRPAATEPLEGAPAG